MNIDGPRESGSMSMDIDDAVSHDWPHRRDSVKMNSPESSGARSSSGFRSQNHELTGSTQTSIHSLPSRPPFDYDHLPGSDHSSQLMVLASSSLEDVGSSCQNHEPTSSFQRLTPPAPAVTLRKRKRSFDLPHMYIMDHNDISHDGAFADSANSQPRRRTRPRLRTPQEWEFPPLLIMSPGGEQCTSPEETISMFHYQPLPNVTSQSHSVHHGFHLESSPEHGPQIIQSRSFPEVDDQESPKEPSRPDSASSFAEVALASAAAPRNHSRLSTLTDFSLPRPFDEAEHSSISSGGIQIVHQRGLDAPPSFSFFSASGGRVGGQRASGQPVGSSTDSLGHPIRPPSFERDAHPSSPRPALRPLVPSTTVFLDKPLCESPEEMNPGEGGVVLYCTGGNSGDR